MLRTAGLPLWVTLWALIVLAFGLVLGVSAMFGAGLDGMENSMSVSWGGRHLGLGLVAGAAVLLRSPSAYVAAFIGCIARDLGDLFAELGKADPNKGVIVGISVFLLISVIALATAIRTRNATVATLARGTAN